MDGPQFGDQQTIFLIFFFPFNFLMLHQLEASQEGFSIKWEQVSQTCPKIEKMLLKEMFPN
jgi:hypothetical protein